MPQEKFTDQLWNGLANAISDIREKAVEEPWFGRVLQEREAPAWPEAKATQEKGPEGLEGEILPPEHSPSPGSDFHRLEHGTIINGEAQEKGKSGSLTQWPQARDAGPQQHHQEREQADKDIER